MDRISELKPDESHWEELYKKEKYKTKVLEAENGQLKSQVEFLKEEVRLITTVKDSQIKILEMESERLKKRIKGDFKVMGLHFDEN